jgi:hypothetical protein
MHECKRNMMSHENRSISDLIKLGTFKIVELPYETRCHTLGVICYYYYMALKSPVIHQKGLKKLCRH